MSDGAIERVEKAIEAIRNGEIVILVDDEDRENEGDFCIAAEKITPEAVNFMATHGRGLIVMPMTGARLDELDIPMMVRRNSSPFGTAFTVSIEAREGVSTGISAADRARTVQVAADPNSTPEDLVSPGHIFPLRARDGGVLARTGQTEGGVDLARLAGLSPAAVVCEIMNEDGTMARMPELEKIAEKHDMLIISIADLIHYRLQRESLIELLEEIPMPTEYEGDWRLRMYRNKVDDTTHMCMICGNPERDEPTLVRVQHRMDTFDVFLRHQSESVETIRAAMRTIGTKGCGVIVYLNKSEASALDVARKHLGLAPEVQDARSRIREVNQPQQTVRDLGLGSQILFHVGVGKMKLLTNRPKKIVGLDGYGLEIVEQVELPLHEEDMSASVA